MWFPVGIFEAFGSAVSGSINKHQVKHIHPIVVLFLNQLTSIFFMGMAIWLFGGFPHVTTKFFFFVFCSSILDCVAFICSYWAVRHTQISLLSPLSSLTPVFATIFGAIFLREFPTPLRILGILVIVLGVYMLNIAQLKDGVFKPFQKLFSEPGVRLYFVQVVIFGITPIFQKQAIFQTSPVTPILVSFASNTLVTAYLFFYILNKVKMHTSYIQKNSWLFLIVGIINTCSQFAAYYVFSTTHVGYATAVFSLSSLFTIVLGGILFKEQHIKERLLGAGIMIIGAVLLAV